MLNTESYVEFLEEMINIKIKENEEMLKMRVFYRKQK